MARDRSIKPERSGVVFGDTRREFRRGQMREVKERIVAEFGGRIESAADATERAALVAERDERIKTALARLQNEEALDGPHCV